MGTSKFEQRFDHKEDSAFLSSCVDQLEVQPFHKKWYKVNFVITPLRYIIQTSSASTAVCAAIFFTYVFFGSLWSGLIAGGLVMGIIEYLKSSSWSVFWKDRVVQKRTNFIALGFCIATAVISASASFFGGPLFAAQFSPGASVISIDSLKAIKQAGEDSIVQHYNKLSEDLEETADKVNEESAKNWSKGSGAKVVALRSASAATKSDSLSTAKNAFASQMMQEIEEAKIKNNISINRRSPNIAFVGYGLAIAMLVGELFICFGVWWSYYYKYRALTKLGIHIEKHNVLQGVRNRTPKNKDLSTKSSKVSEIVHLENDTIEPEEEEEEEELEEELEEEVSVQKKSNVSPIAVKLPSCAWCNTQFLPKKANQKFCSAKCRNSNYNKGRTEEAAKRKAEKLKAAKNKKK